MMGDAEAVDMDASFTVKQLPMLNTYSQVPNIFDRLECKVRCCQGRGRCCLNIFDANSNSIQI